MLVVYITLEQSHLKTQSNMNNIRDHVIRCLNEIDMNLNGQSALQILQQDTDDRLRIDNKNVVE